MKKYFIIFVVLTLSLSLQGQNSLGVFNRGSDSLIYNGYAPLADKPITIYYYIPKTGNIKNMPVLITFHGAEREGKNPRDSWMDFAERDGFVVIAPEFSKTYYDENAYQFGNVFVSKEDHTLNNEDIWTYSVIEPIFNFFKEQTGNKAKVYSIQGHSAGGQFTHRYLLAKPNAKVDIAVASNAGTWTWLDKDGSINGSEESYEWPYTVKGTPFSSEEYIKSFLGRDLVIHLGDSDTTTTGAYISDNEPSLAQGAFRYERGKKYFQSSKEIAEKYGIPFKWEIVVVKGVGHRGKGMVYARSSRDENNVRTYSVSEIRKTGAYSIIFGDRY